MKKIHDINRVVHKVVMFFYHKEMKTRRTKCEKMIECENKNNKNKEIKLSFWIYCFLFLFLVVVYDKDWLLFFWLVCSNESETLLWVRRKYDSWFIGTMDADPILSIACSVCPLWLDFLYYFFFVQDISRIKE